jgi:hypothetical protein
MKKLSAAVLATIATAHAALAGGLSPDIEIVTVGPDTAASSVSPLLILGLLVLIGVLVSRNNDSNVD